MQSFQALSAARVLTAAPAAGVSTLQEMLQPTLPEAIQQRQFAQLYAQHQGDWASFWPAAERLFGAAATAQLQMTGQLYALTVNNQPLVSALMTAEAGAPLTSTQDLAARGYYTPGKWAPLIGSSIPPGIPGADADEQASNYAQLLAAQVRIAFPTAVLADQVAQGTLPVTGTAQTATEVAGFLTTNQGQFEIGAEPVEAYLARTGLTGTPAAVVTEVKRLQRAYQLTPDDASLGVLLRHNLDSAFAVTRYDADGFTRAFASQLGGPDAAAAIHARARQIFAATLSVTVAYLGGRIAPGLGGQAPVQYGYPPPPPPAAVVPTGRRAVLPGRRRAHARGSLRVPRLLQLLGLQLDPEPGRLPRRPAELHRPARACDRVQQPAGRPARPPARPAVPAADLRQHQHGAALHRHRQRDARVLRGQRADPGRLSGTRHRRRDQLR